MKNRTTFIAISLLILVGCGPSEQKKRVDPRPVQVSVQSIRSVEYKIPVRTTGLLSTTTEMKLSFKTGGIIGQIDAREGRSVTGGDVLAVLDLSEVKARIPPGSAGILQ